MLYRCKYTTFSLNTSTLGENIRCFPLFIISHFVSNDMFLYEMVSLISEEKCNFAIKYNPNDEKL